MKKEISVIIPAYNEEENLEETVESVVAHFRAKGYPFEVLVVNDGSKDSTLSKAQLLQSRHREVRVINFELNRGKGMAVKEGISQARFTYCLFMDADNATSVKEWDKCEPFFESGSRVVVASRRLPASRIVHPQPFMRRGMGGVYRLLSRGLFGLSVSDFNCGFKAYETSLAKDVYSQVRMLDWTFDTEVFCLLKKMGVRVEEVPVEWEHRDKHSALVPLRAGLSTLASLWRLKRYHH